MGGWVSIIVAIAAGIWGAVNPEAVLRFLFSKRYEVKGKTPTFAGKLIIRIICILTLFSAVFMVVSTIR